MSGFFHCSFKADPYTRSHAMARRVFFVFVMTA